MFPCCKIVNKCGKRIELSGITLFSRMVSLVLLNCLLAQLLSAEVSFGVAGLEFVHLVIDFF